MRGAAALYVVCHHAVRQVITVGEHLNDPFYRLLQLLTFYGHYAVDVFIVLSGYSLMLPVLARQQFGNVWIFYLRRTIRIVLPYYAALLFSLLLIYFFIGENDGSHWAKVALPVTIDSILKHVLLIHQWFPEASSKINPAFWSVGVEYQIYFLFPLFYWAAIKIGYLYTFILVSLFSYSLWGISYYLDVFNPSSTGASLYYCALFFMGMTAAHLANKNKPDSSNKWILALDLHAKNVAIIAISCFFVLAATDHLIHRFLSNPFFPLQIQSFFVGLFTSMILYLKGKQLIKKPNFHILTFIQNKLQLLGVVGFSLYLVHDPVLAVVWKYVVTPLNIQAYWLQTVTELSVGLTACIIIAVVFYKLIELPCHQLSKSLIKKQQNRDRFISVMPR
jgi:peptidoglycan/LPS O-acetylase OafA/YrhL